MSIQVELQNDIKDPEIPSAKTMTQWLNQAITIIPNKIPANQNEITIRVVSSAESAELNEQFRHKKGPTNVLSFPDNPIAGFEADSLGDLAICAELVAIEAKQQEKSIEAHWAHLVVHGFLHLLGYDHIEDNDAKIMEQLEVDILKSLNFPNPY